ncbi:MAG: hypothetical protein HY834_11080 [Devosia nanyangense]|uniref:DUF4142 domain-containing protein n=1 Tax=Devosia nanyangense TaxID=1228055 RepID=A0A933L4P3_9HYPH|nr:hypothetical protein [Devosia nanyangense]
MARFLRALALGATLATTILVSACARPVGDFGRAEPEAIHADFMPATAAFPAAAHGEATSAFNLSDQEREMQNRIWRFLVSPHAVGWFGDGTIALGRARATLPPTDQYYRWLHRQEFASSRVRYARVADDVTADIAAMPKTFAAICAVLDIDRQRGIATSEISGLEPAMLEDAAARRAENRTTIARFVDAAANRYDAYSYALDHLLVETPHQEAVEVDGLLSDLATYVGAAEQGEFC